MHRTGKIQGLLAAQDLAGSPDPWTELSKMIDYEIQKLIELLDLTREIEGS